jgi:hypothetical protein
MWIRQPADTSFDLQKASTAKNQLSYCNAACSYLQILSAAGERGGGFLLRMRNEASPPMLRQTHLCLFIVCYCLVEKIFTAANWPYRSLL